MPILDVALLVSGFLLRVLFGSAITGISISAWLYLTVLSVSFYLALGKRRNELGCAQDETRKVLKFYTYAFLDKNMQISMALAIMFYSLWSIDAAPGMIWTVPLVICLCLKYSLTIEGDSTGDPVEVIYQDKALLILGAVLAVAILAIIYK